MIAVSQVPESAGGDVGVTVERVRIATAANLDVSRVEAEKVLRHAPADVQS